MNVAEMAKVRSGRWDAREELVPTRRTLLERLRNLDDEESWQEFFSIYWKLVYCAAVKAGLSDAEAEDVVQETIIGVARRMPEFRYDPQVCSFKGWLMHVTRRRIIDALRKRQRQAQRFEPFPADTGTREPVLQVPDAAAEGAFAKIWDEEWEKNLVDSAMERVKRTVNPEHYQIFFLHSVKSMPARDIGELMGVSAAKVYVVQHRVGQLVKRAARALSREAAGARQEMTGGRKR